LCHFTTKDITTEYIAWLNDPQVVKYSNQRFICHTEESCQSFLRSFDNSDNIFVNIRMQENELAIGTMTAYVSRQHETVDIGIMIGDCSVWGRGLGQDAWNTLLNWFINQRRIRKATAGTMRCNRPMIKLMERSGMSLEAVRTRQEMFDGNPQDMLLYQKFCEH
jgi:ribosomal-protein-alanine N-acetyltransferase